MRELLRYFKSFWVVILCFMSAFFVLLFSWLPKGGIYPFISQKVWGPGLLWLAGAKLQVEGLENLEKGKHYIFYSNHRSLYDIPSLCASIPEPLYFIAKKELQKIPVFGWGMYSIGMVFVDRSNPEKARASMAKAGAVIKRGKSILAFPEGTRSKTGKLQPFKKGVFHMARSGSIPMVPVAVTGTEQVLPLTGKLASGNIKVCVGEPISADFVAQSSIAALSAAAHVRLADLLGQSHATDVGMEQGRTKEETKPNHFRQSEQSA